ncbi:MAG: ATP-binding protein [Phycisphaeraceae bacterium]|nr:ATP-binding protein [Phycisphaeraceae bacterium]
MQLWANAGVPRLHRERRREELLESDAWKAAYRIATEIVDQGGILLAIGKRGNGKTQLGVELIRDACKAGRTGRYVRSRQIGMKLREAFKGDITEAEALDVFTKPHLLVIDEIQEKPESDFEQRSLTLLIDIRYGDKKPTVLCGNVSAEPGKIQEMLSPSILDRSREGGGVLAFDWPSFRGDA